MSQQQQQSLSQERPAGPPLVSEAGEVFMARLVAQVGLGVAVLLVGVIAHQAARARPAPVELRAEREPVVLPAEVRLVEAGGARRGDDGVGGLS